ncbi:ADP-polyphosphate phosphotransferase [Eoetvoesiella caeni]|uniref:Polyphosphate:AMP phosphotransferase n=1 Tax=Eoetvoesiella caeni TaxID=645616 RepID=A0A366HEI3_9BURK|nr:ADP-polyphosphate phosphotransferase [Eoetvoesiella caeni]MCI2808565.1 polyphosphate kinase 2 family protein [Eoetvoesiella caeni]NYT55105.1 polyphosphate kinase 2 family protein [Eoetvoesiella caeni]RBP40915.1 polyphosphate:AMP phosphotransferase [Eoetvoesiella caeni]
MQIDPEQYRIKKGLKVNLDTRSTQSQPLYKSKNDYEDALAKQVKELTEQQELLYASNQYAVLLIFQAMDAAGKDSTIKHVMSGINPQGCQVHSFKQPSTLERQHDFLWRTTLRLPQRGQIGIFNRSYYEEVLVVRVHPEILAAQNIPDAPHQDEAIWTQRYRSIVDHERHLFCNGTRIMKFFLHVSKDEQRKRFIERIDTPEKNWKFSATDVTERAYWNEYMKAYEQCISATSSQEAPWYIVPADDKDNMRLIVSRIIVDTLKGLEMAFPTVDKTRLQEQAVIRKELSQ